VGVLREINDEGSFNRIFSDGVHLFCYFDDSEYNGMFFIRKSPPYSRAKLIDEDWEIDLSDPR
jgi:glutamine amidotransferase